MTVATITTPEGFTMTCEVIGWITGTYADGSKYMDIEGIPQGCTVEEGDTVTIHGELAAALKQAIEDFFGSSVTVILK